MHTVNRVIVVRHDLNDYSQEIKVPQFDNIDEALRELGPEALDILNKHRAQMILQGVRSMVLENARRGNS